MYSIADSVSRVKTLPSLGAFLQQASRRPDVPIVFVEVQFYELVAAECCEILLSRSAIALVVRNPVDAPIAALPYDRVGSVAGIFVIPVDQIDRAFRAGAQCNAAKPVVVCQHEILAMGGDES